MENDWNGKGYFVTGDDVLVCKALASVANTLAFRLQYVPANSYGAVQGMPRTIEIPLVVPSTRVVQTVVRGLVTGYVIGAAIVETTSNLTQTGQCYASMTLAHGNTTTYFSTLPLIGNYVLRPGLSWVYGAANNNPVVASTDWTKCAGNLRSVTGSNPAAGAEISETVPTGAVWRLRSVYIDGSIDASGVAVRGFSLTLDDGTNIFSRIQSATGRFTFAVGAATVKWSLTVAAQYSAYYGNAVPPSALVITDPLGGAGGPVLQAGYRIRTVTSNLQGTDDYAAPQLEVEEFLVM